MSEEQLSLLVTRGNPTGTGWRHTSGHLGGADTELNAAVANPSARLTFRAKLLEAYREAGENGLTDPEAQATCGMSLPGDAGARRHELVRIENHEIIDSGKRRLSPRGKPCIVWVLR